MNVCQVSCTYLFPYPFIAGLLALSMVACQSSTESRRDPSQESSLMQKTAYFPPPEGKIYTQVVDRLKQIPLDKRTRLQQLPEGTTPSKLNERVPEINEIELDNSISSSSSSDTSLQLIAWNTERGRYFEEYVKLIQEDPAFEAPDIIFLGEMDLGMARSFNAHTTKEMATRLQMNYAYGVEFLELTLGSGAERKEYSGENQWGYHGNAILSKYPLRDLQMIRFPGIEKWYQHEQQRLGGRMALFAKVNIGTSEIALVVTHLESGKDQINEKIRVKEMDMLINALQGYAPDIPVILGGDLNTSMKSELFQYVHNFGFEVEEANDLTSGTGQEYKGGRVHFNNTHIDYLCVKGFNIIKDKYSPTVVPAVYPPGELKGKMLADHAVVSLRVSFPPTSP